MTDESNLEFMGKVKAEKLTSLAEDAKNELAEIHADQAHWKSAEQIVPLRPLRVSVKSWRSF